MYNRNEFDTDFLSNKIDDTYQNLISKVNDLNELYDQLPDDGTRFNAVKSIKREVEKDGRFKLKRDGKKFHLATSESVSEETVQITTPVKPVIHPTLLNDTSGTSGTKPVTETVTPSLGGATGTKPVVEDVTTPLLNTTTPTTSVHVVPVATEKASDIASGGGGGFGSAAKATAQEAIAQATGFLNNPKFVKGYLMVAGTFIIPVAANEIAKLAIKDYANRTQLRNIIFVAGLIVGGFLTSKMLAND